MKLFEGTPRPETIPHRVMAGLVPAIHVPNTARHTDVDARNECGHDGVVAIAKTRP